MNQNNQIFLVEDDLSFGAVLKSYLEMYDFRVTWVDDGKYALDKFRNGSYHLCLLDVMLPNIDGFTLGKEIRVINPEIPMIFLTAKNLREDVLEGYRTGADDYITKPFDTEVLLYKIQAIITRQSKTVEPVKTYTIGSFLFDPKLRQITRDGKIVQLSPKESELLGLLCQHVNGLLPRETALLRIWGDDGYFTARSMDVFITRLRKYLAEDQNVEIKNIHGSGFSLEIAVHEK